MTLPFITLVIIGFAPGVYYVKYIISRILNEDFIKTLKIMGIPQKSILYKHALKNAGPQTNNNVWFRSSGNTGRFSFS